MILDTGCHELVLCAWCVFNPVFGVGYVNVCGCVFDSTVVDIVVVHDAALRIIIVRIPDGTVDHGLLEYVFVFLGIDQRCGLYSPDMRQPSLAKSFTGIGCVLDHIVLGQRLGYGRVQRIIVLEIWQFQHITVHEFTTICVYHVVVMERDKQGIIVEEQAKLCEVKVYVLAVVNTAHDIDVLIIHPVPVFQQQKILDVQRALCVVDGLGGVGIATESRVLTPGLGT